jgi:hypothetical protein
MPAPNLAQVKTYLGSEQSWTDAEITAALEAETAAQASVCRVPASRSAMVTTTNGSPTVTAAADTFLDTDTSSEVTGTGIPVGATITAYISSSSVTISANATASGSVTATIAEAWPADLGEALKRRVQRNLSMKSLPLGLQSGASEAGQWTIRVGSDPEVKRLEAPFRKLTVG